MKRTKPSQPVYSLNHIHCLGPYKLRKAQKGLEVPFQVLAMALSIVSHHGLLLRVALRSMNRTKERSCTSHTVPEYFMSTMPGFGVVGHKSYEHVVNLERY